MGDNDQTTTDAETPEAPETQQDQTSEQSGDGISLSRNAFNDRINRAKKSGVNDLLQTLGFDSTDALSGFVQAQREAGKATQDAKDEAQTAMEAMQARIDALEDAAKQAQDKAKELAEQRLEEQRTKALTEAAKGARDPQDIVAWATTNNRLDDLIKEDGTVDAEKVQAVIDDARKAKPYLFVTGPGSPSNAGGTPTPLDKKQREAAAASQQAHVRRTGW